MTAADVSSHHLWVWADPERNGTGVAAETLYELVGPLWFDELAVRFYDKVLIDPLLRPLYPKDLEGPINRLAGFLRQYWGGPPDYSAERGHPRLRMRHAPFAIGPAQRDAWLRSMIHAVQGGGLSADAESVVVEYFMNAAQHLVNAPE